MLEVDYAPKPSPSERLPSGHLNRLRGRRPASNRLRRPRSGRAGLNIHSASRCNSRTASPRNILDSELGGAIDANLIVPDSTTCDRLYIAEGYCAFHRSKASCSHIRRQPRNAKNTFINNFLTCAGNEGLQVGATLTTGDWNHFERDIADKATAFSEYQLQLRAYCNRRCPQARQFNSSPQACDCPGY
jgi:hypothetical protein